MSSIILLGRDVNGSPCTVSLNRQGSELFMGSVTESIKSSPVYSFSLDLAEHAIYTDLPDSIKKISLYGSIGDFGTVRINTLDESGTVRKHFECKVRMFKYGPFKPFDSVKDTLQPWDVFEALDTQTSSFQVATVTSMSGTPGDISFGFDCKNGLGTKNLLVALKTRRGTVGFPKGYDYPNNYLGVENPVSTKAFRFTKVAYRPYYCQGCGGEQSVQVNHFGTCWGECKFCSWRVNAYGPKFSQGRWRPLIPAALANLTLRYGIERALKYYEANVNHRKDDEL